jgi:cation-transporting ATPase 13A2
MILLEGQCVVNEAMLTGESAAVIKQAVLRDWIISDYSDLDLIKKHTIFSGTKIIQARPSD